MFVFLQVHLRKTLLIPDCMVVGEKMLAEDLKNWNIIPQNNYA